MRRAPWGLITTPAVGVTAGKPPVGDTKLYKIPPPPFLATKNKKVITTFVKPDVLPYADMHFTQLSDMQAHPPVSVQPSQLYPHI